MLFFSSFTSELLTMIVHTIFIVGLLATVASFFISKIPLLSIYIMPIRMISAVFLIAGIFFEGALSNEQKWKQRTVELEAQLKVAERSIEELNETLKTKQKEKIRVITKTKVEVQEKIKVVKEIIDVKCPEVAPEAVDLLNSAAKNQIPGDKK